MVAQRAGAMYDQVARARFVGRAGKALAVGWAPGRVNLIGEHTDYSEGYVLPAAIDRMVALAGRAEDEPYATLYSAHHHAWASISLAASDDDGAGDDTIPLWARYIQATWRQLALAAATPACLGFSAAIYGDVPVGGGLSSSAALEVATAMFARALGGAELPAMTTARLCQRAEQEGADVQVGIMDQAASCLGRPDHAILLDCRTLEASYIAMNMPDVTWVVFDTQTPHSLAASEYNIRRAQCEAAVARIAPALAGQTPGRRIATLRDVTASDLDRYGSLLDDTLFRRARHVVTENERTLRAAEALRAGDAARFGALMNMSHASLRDDYAVSSMELNAAVEIAVGTPGTLGARMMGAGFGGSILALVRRDALAQLRSRLTADYPRATGRSGELFDECAITGRTGARAASGPA
jgi:galactokinase